MTEVPAGHPEKPEGEDGFALLERMNGGRHEELALWGLSFLPISDDAHALDIGCGGGANIARLLERAPQGYVIGVDYSPVSVQASRSYNTQAIAEGRCQVFEANASQLPFDPCLFDVITAFETTYYWDLPTAFSHVLRVLKPGGSFLVCNEDDGDDPGSLEFAEQIPGMVMYTCEQLISTLEKAGFEIATVQRIPSRGYVAIVARRPF